MIISHCTAIDDTYVGLNAVNSGDALFYQPAADAIDVRSMLLSDSYRFATALDYNNKYTSFMTKAFSMGLGTVHQTGSIQVTPLRSFHYYIPY